MTYQVSTFNVNWVAVPRKVNREQIAALEKELIRLEDGEVCTIKHHFAKGLYAREMFMPKDSTLTGMVHRCESIVIVVGDLETVINGEVVRLTGHNTFVSKVGEKRAMYSYEDSWVTGIFATDETDVVKLENELVEDADNLQYRRLRRKELETSCS